MNRRISLHRAAIGALLACIGLSVMAQDAPRKPPRRLTPNPADTNRVPAGVDTGSPATTDAMPLGTPVPPVGGADGNELKNRSAAARAAARPRSASAPLDTPTSKRVPAGPAALGAETDSRNQTATSTAAERSALPKNSRPASAPR